MVVVNEPKGDYLKPAEAAKVLRVTTATLLRWVRKGRLQAVTLPSGQHRYRKEDIAKLQSGEVPDA